jgi:hypothetical protein
LVISVFLRASALYNWVFFFFLHFDSIFVLFFLSIQCSDGWQHRDKCSQRRPRQHPHVFLLAFGLFPGGPGFIGVNDSLDDKSSNECDDVGDVLFCQRRLPGRHVCALADGEASFGYHGGQIFVGHCLDVAFAGKRPDMWHEALAAASAVWAVTALTISQEDRFAVTGIPGCNRRR